MHARTLTALLSAAATAALMTASGAQAQGAAALSGTVHSAEEGAMEGVLVTAKKDGAHISTTVVSDAKGHYAFPAGRLEPGHYTIKIRASGYFADGRPAADITGGKSATADINLKKTDNLAPQLTNAEWLNSMPGTDAQKNVLQNCTSCHTLQRIVTSVHTAEDFAEIIPRMGTYAPGSQPQRPQKLVPGPRDNRGIVDQKAVKSAAEYLASVDLSKVPEWTYPLQTLPRPTGRATHVIITSYDLARPEAMPHDVIVHDGKVWYSDFGSQFVGEMDPKTGKITDIPIPVLKPEEPKGLLELKTDSDGNVWASMMYQGGIAKIDPKTNKVTTYKVPEQWQSADTQESMVSPMHSNVDNMVWTNNQEDHSVLRVNVKTGEWENLGRLKDQNGHYIAGYDIISDDMNNLFLLEFGGVKIGEIDAKAKTLMTWEPSLPAARPRRGHFDEHGVLWYAEYGSNAVGRFDPKTQKITEWQMPVKWELPYDALANKKGEVWTGSMLTDRVVRLDPKTGESVAYLMPGSTNIRRVFFDDDHNALWIGSNHGNQILKVEPLD